MVNWPVQFLREVHYVQKLSDEAISDRMSLKTMFAIFGISNVFLEKFRITWMDKLTIRSSLVCDKNAASYHFRYIHNFTILPIRKQCKTRKIWRIEMRRPMYYNLLRKLGMLRNAVRKASSISMAGLISILIIHCRKSTRNMHQKLWQYRML